MNEAVHPSTPVVRHGRDARRLNVLLTRPNGGGNGGMDRLADSICAQTEALREAGVSVVPVTTRSPKNLALAGVKFAIATGRLLAGGISGRTDVVHLNVASEGSVYRKMALGRLARAVGTPYIVHLHSDRIIGFWTKASPRVAQAMDRFLAESSGVIVLGRMWSDFILARNPGLASKVMIVPNATQPARVPPKVRIGGPVHIACLGLLGPRKGTRLLLEALSRIKDRTDWRATLAGDGEVEQARAYARELGLSDRVAIPGWLGPDDAAAVLAETDIFALPSNSEGLPMAILEAFSYGIPVIATDVGAVTEVVETEHNGLVVARNDAPALANALTRMIEDPAMRARMGAAGKRKHDENYRFDVYMKRLIEIWRTAAGR